MFPFFGGKFGFGCLCLDKLIHVYIYIYTHKQIYITYTYIYTRTQIYTYIIGGIPSPKKITIYYIKRLQTPYDKITSWVSRITEWRTLMNESLCSLSMLCTFRLIRCGFGRTSHKSGGKCGNGIQCTKHLPYSWDIVHGHRMGIGTPSFSGNPWRCGLRVP